MSKYHILVLAILQILAGILSSVYLIKVLLGTPITISPILIIANAYFGLTLGYKNIIKFKRLNK